MNLIVIVLDSFRQDHVGVYHQGQAAFEGIAPCETPNLDAFAKNCVVFDNAYPEALPTIPIRCQLMTGQRTLPFRPWEPLAPQDVTIAEILRREEYVCGLVSDTYHYRAPGQNFHRGFHAFRCIRGQEYDAYESAPTRRDINGYVNENYPESWRRLVAQFLANTDEFAGEEDWFASKVVDEAISWLRKNRVHKNIFLWVDSFDPHEPWDPPKRFDTYTDPAYHGPRIILPMGGPAAKWATPDQIKEIQGLYAGEAAFVDHCLGRLFTAIEELGYLDDSLIFVLADHGHPLGDHGKFLKGPDRMFNELLKVPFFVHVPGGKNAGRRTGAIVQFHDLLPTALDTLGLSNNTSAMHGRSFRPVLEGDSDDHRDMVITGFHEGADRCVRDREWSLVLRPENEPDELYHLPSDPRERHNLIDERRDVAERMARAFGTYFFNSPRSAVIKGSQHILLAESAAGQQPQAVAGIQGKYETAAGGVD